MHGTIGILGGMGPMATADFFRKVIEETRAKTDQEHMPVMMCSLPATPCRSRAILADGESPLPWMLDGLTRLTLLQVDCVAIPCNTAHHWYEQLRAQCSVPLLHIVDAVHDELMRQPTQPRRLGLLATRATLTSRVYQNRLAHAHYEFCSTTADEQENLIEQAITLVKRGELQPAGHLLEQAVQKLLERGVETPILACTELPVALEAIASPLQAHCIDATRALARLAVTWANERRSTAHASTLPEIALRRA